ncbi:MAG: hypothetical protein ACREXS_06900 [Gammaproteobacteria bacterium]
MNVSDQVEAIQSGKPNGKDAPDWPKERPFAAWLKYLALEYRSDSQMAPKVTGECKACEFRIDKRESELKSGFEECWTKALALRPGEFNHRIPIFGIWGLQAPKLLEKGVYFIDSLSEDDLIPKTKSKTVEPSGLNASRRRVLQWSKTLENSSKHYFDKGSFLKAIEDYAYPLHFIDFETSMVAIPFNKGRRPYETDCLSILAPRTREGQHHRA